MRKKMKKSINQYLIIKYLQAEDEKNYVLCFLIYLPFFYKKRMNKIMHCKF